MSVATSERVSLDYLYRNISISPEEAQEMEDRAIEDFHSAQNETYGRSLSAIRSLGRVAAAESYRIAVNSPEASQARVEFFTSVEEGFGTDSELGRGLEVRDFDHRPVIDGHIVSKDPNRSVVSMTFDGLKCAQEKYKEESALGNHNFKSQLIRSFWDHDNAQKCDQMARGKTDYNTRIVVSPYPEEAHLVTGGKYWGDLGYVPHLRRGFVQIYYSGPDGLVAGSLSFDGSNKARLREVFAKHGVNIPEEEVTDNWLKYAITGEFTEKQAKAIALELADDAADPSMRKNTNTVDVTAKYSDIMNSVFDKSYVLACQSMTVGKQVPGIRNLIQEYVNNSAHFNARYKKALAGMQSYPDKFTEDDMVVMHELLVYSTIEMMRAIHVEARSGDNLNDVEKGYYHYDAHTEYIRSAMASGQLDQAIGGFSGIGASNNRGYSACGLSISPGEEASNGADGPQSAFGGAESRERLSWHGGKIKKGKCVNCKERTDVGVASWCKKCIKC